MVQHPFRAFDSTFSGMIILIALIMAISFYEQYFNFLISSQCSPRLTWIEVGDELMRVLFASFPVGVLVLVPVGCLRVIPGKVQIKTLMNIRCKVALQTEMDTTTKFLDSAKNQ